MAAAKKTAAKKTAATKRAAAPPDPADATPETPAGSEQTGIVPAAADEPVRRGGHVLTDDGWVPENSKET